MKTIFIFSFFVFLNSLITGCSNLNPPDENDKEIRREALVMGNNNYPYLSNGQLTKAVNDAQDVAAALGRLGFKVFYGENLTCQEMLNLVDDFTQEVNENSLVFIYYSGHGGADDRGLNYILASDYRNKENSRCTPIPNQPNEYAPALPIDKIVFTLKEKEKKPRSVILALDMCRNNSPSLSEKGSKGIGKGDISITSPYNPDRYEDDGILISYATGQGNTSNEGREIDRNSRYTKYLLKYLETPSLSLSDLFGKVSDEVNKESQGKQIPWKQGSLEGNDLFLARKRYPNEPPAHP